MSVPTAGGYEAARQQFSSEGVPFPYIPLSLRPSLARIDDWYYATDPTSAHEGQRALFDRLKDDRLYDLARLMHIGHGINSWMFRYEIVLRPLVLQLERPWGGVYTGSDPVALRETFAAAQRLIEAAETHSAAFAPNEYLAVIDTPIAGGQWLRLTVPTSTHPLAMAWNESADVLSEALRQF